MREVRAAWAMRSRRATLTTSTLLTILFASWSCSGALASPSARDPSVHSAKTARFDAGVFAGLLLLGRDLELGVPDRPGQVPGPRVVNAIMGVRLSLALSRYVHIELESGWSPTQDREDALAAHLMLVRGNVRLHLGDNALLDRHFISPFLLAGVGMVAVVSTEGHIDAVGNHYGLARKDADAEFHLGVGITWRPHPRVVVRYDTRMYQIPNTKRHGLTATWELCAAVAYIFGG